MSYWQDSFSYTVVIEPLHDALPADLWGDIAEIMRDVFDESLLERRIERHLKKRLAQLGVSAEEIEKYLEQGPVFVESV